jgi:hypothetical protein
VYCGLCLVVGIAMQQFAQAEELSPGFGQEIILG